MKAINRNKSLQQLEEQDWGEPTFNSHLVHECHRLRRVPLKDFTIENLRIMLGQDIGTKYLLPIALEHLRTNPLSEGNFYPGDLLVSILRLPFRFWQMRPDLRREAAELAERTISMCNATPEDSTVELKAIREAFGHFQGINGLKV